MLRAGARAVGRASSVVSEVKIPRYCLARRIVRGERVYRRRTTQQCPICSLQQKDAMDMPQHPRPAIRSRHISSPRRAVHVKLAMLRRGRGALNMGSTLHRSSNSRQALDACALALLSTSRNFVKALHGASDYPTTSPSTWSHLAERPFTSSRPKSAAPCSPSPSLQALGAHPHLIVSFTSPPASARSC